ncbi:MAG: molybdenum ABC transporter ATP-binding protein [Congregibacter sp.]
MSLLKLQLDQPYADGFRVQLNTEIPLQGITAVFGPSGSGKTTLLDCVAGLNKHPGSSHLIFDEQVWQDATHHTPSWQRGIAYVFQDARLFPHLSVAENLDYAAARARPGGLSRERVTGLLEIEELLGRSPDALSAGQQQRVAIARALLSNPRLLLLDEPLANLDQSTARRCLYCLERISRETGLPMLYVSHQIEEIHAIADRLLVLDNGRLLASGPLLELAGRLDTAIAEDESAAALLLVEVGEKDARYGLTELRVDKQSLWVAADGAIGDRRRLRVPARDVSVCRDAPSSSSILNILPVTLRAVREVSDAHCLLRLEIAEQYLLARITRRSRDELSLVEGDRLYAQIKSTALLGDAHCP